MASKEIIEYLFKGNPTDLLQATEKVKNGLKGVGKTGDTAASEVDQSFSRMASGMKRAGDKMQTVGKALTIGVTLPLVYAFKQMADMAIDDAAAVGKLEGSLKRTTGATRDQLDAVNEWIDKTSISKGVVDDELRPAFERLARATGSTEQAQKDLNLALDVSRATGKDLDSVTQAMAKAYNGSEGALGRLGIATKDAEGNTLSLKTIMETMNRQFGGAADDWANSTAGRAEIAKIKFSELQEELGAAVVPVMQDLVEVAGWVIDKFTALPDWVQKSLVAFVAFKGPIMWLGGAGVKLVEAMITKIIAMRVASEAAAGAAGGLAGAAGAAGGSAGMLALSSGAGAATAALGSGGLMGVLVKVSGFLGQGLGLARVVEWAAPVIEYSDKIGESWGRLEDSGFTLGGSIKEVTGFFADLAELITGTGIIREGLGYVDTVTGWIGINAGLKDSFNSLVSPVRDFFDLFANGDQGDSAPDDVAYRWATGFKFFNDIIANLPQNIDSNRAALEELALKSGWTADEIEGLNQAVEDFQTATGLIDASLAAERSMRDLAVAVIEAKTTTDDAKTAQDEHRLALDNLEDSALRTADTMVKNWQQALSNGTMTEEEATRKKEELLGALNNVKAQVPGVAATIDRLAGSVNNVPTRREINFEAKGMDAVREAARKLAADLQGINNIRFAATFTGQKLARNERGGVIPFAKGGMYMANSGGGITRGPMAVIGEGREPREYVIPTDPRFRDRALGLMNQASAELGVVRAQSGGSTFAPTINVSGAMDPQATAAAVADAIEQAFAKKKRRDGSLAFT